MNIQLLPLALLLLIVGIAAWCLGAALATIKSRLLLSVMNYGAIVGFLLIFSGPLSGSGGIQKFLPIFPTAAVIWWFTTRQLRNDEDPDKP